MDLITKRLHISGLTPNISPKDLEGRFASFGTVKALDGLNLRDGNGDPRRFAYVTLEGSKAQVAKCLNVLSGATWKGAKLRVGEAKADYRERIAKENDAEHADEDSSRPKKRRRLLRGTQGVHASDMSLVTAENCVSRSGAWIKTPMGRLVRPMRMRPVRPLPLPSTTTTTVKSRGSDVKERKKTGKKKDVMRTRRKLINPLLYGSEYLKGVLLEGEVRGVPETTRRDGGDVVPAEAPRTVSVQKDTLEADGEIDEEEAEEEVDMIPDGEPSLLVTPIPVAPSSSTTSAPKDLPPRTHEPTTDFAQEAKNDLRLLDSLFGGGDEDDWGGQESLSDVDVMESQVVAVPGSGALDDDFEVVPREKASNALADDRLTKVTADEEDEERMDVDGDANPDAEKGNLEAANAASSKSSATIEQATKLKDMFVPREQDAGFSLFANLDLELDLELDDDVTQAAPLLTQYALAPFQAETPFTQQPPSAHTSSTYTASITTPSFEPNRTLFFPLPSNSSNKIKIKQKDIYTVLNERNWLGAPPFERTETEEEIRKGWEEKKADLTAEWKARWRAARKRGAGAGAGVGS